MCIVYYPNSNAGRRRVRKIVHARLLLDLRNPIGSWRWENITKRFEIGVCVTKATLKCFDEP